KDAWFAGYTPNIVCVVWVGYDNNADIGLTGGVLAAPIWADFMIRALRVRPELGGSFEDPGGLVVLDIDPKTGAPPIDPVDPLTAMAIALRHELFLAGTEPTGAQPPLEGQVPGSDPSADGSSTPPKSPDDSGYSATSGATGGSPDARKPESRPETAP